MRRRHRAGTGFVLWQLPVHKHLTRLKLLCSYESLPRIVTKGGEKRKEKTARQEKNFSAGGVYHDAVLNDAETYAGKPS